MAFNLETYKEPFWAKSGNFLRGRDPLGIQNSSISVYASLLPGMTNLTLRLRYYGTYLWLLNNYDTLPSDNKFKKDQNGQYTFIRRAELILAFVMINKFPDVQSVAGSNYVSKNLNEIKEKGFYDIALGADKHKETVKGSLYWDYTSGALGQYYAGSLVALELVDLSNGYFIITEERGKALAEAYGSSLSVETAKLFLECINKGKLYPDDIDRLDEITLNRNYENTPEGDFYIKMLLADDGVKNKTASNELPSQRKESLQLFMTLLNQTNHDKAWLELPLSSYKTCLSKSKAEVKDATFGWYYYFLNELAHYFLETVFWGLLREMASGSYTLQRFISHINTEVIQKSDSIIKDSGNVVLGNLITYLQNEQYDTLTYIDDIADSVKNNDSITGIFQGVIAILSLFGDNKHKLEEAKEYALNHYLDSKHGNALDIFDVYVKSCKEGTFEEFISSLVQTVLNQHIVVAYNKMGNGEKNLLKFVIEDNYLVHIENMEPNFTNPRLRTLHNFTKDLNLVNLNDELTPEGEALLNELNS